VLLDLKAEEVPERKTTSLLEPGQEEFGRAHHPQIDILRGTGTR